ncbi:DUF4349 domain-containing protein [Streptomyces sp. 7N604]|uniref:DUF4349 domain-containing protein n=1 Tax=Streptomyces sp. 7N604 TaxID=3457415 RepID=UPI003FD126BA
MHRPTYHPAPSPVRGPSTARPARRRRPLTVLASVLLAASLGLAGCSGSSGGSVAESAADAKGGAPREGAAAPGQAEGGPAVGDQRQQPGGTTDGKAAPSRAPKLGPSHIIRTATLTVRVKDVSGAVGDARTTAENAGGYVGDETTDREARGHERSRIVLRVPQDEFEGVLDDLAGSGRLIERKVDAQDVTDQVVDVESRVKSQEASVARVRELMDRATRLSDIVSLEGELSTRQAELEALKAQQQSLKERTGMATITLVLTETAPKPALKPGDDEPGFLDALSGGWDAFVTTVRWIAVAVGAVLPFAAALALLFVIWRVVRGRLPRRAPDTPALATPPGTPSPSTPGPRGVTPPPPVTVPPPITSPEQPEESRPEESRKEE